MRLMGVLLAAIGLLTVPAAATEMHGQTDLFNGPGVTMAWGVLRGADEARTFVVVRVKAGPGIESVVVTARDPFSNAQKLLQRSPLAKGRVEVRIPRASFAEHPRTEWVFLGNEKDPPLTVFYLGVPDTTPEFADEGQLDAYLERRIISHGPNPL